jgi:hypothetical protein
MKKFLLFPRLLLHLDESDYLMKKVDFLTHPQKKEAILRRGAEI